MKLRVIILTMLIASWSFGAALGDDAKAADLKARIEQLEKRVAELEQAVKDLRASAKEAPRTELEKLLVGNWVVAEADKKHAVGTDLKLNGNGTCSVAYLGSIWANSTYQVTGKQIVFDVRTEGAGRDWRCRSCPSLKRSWCLRPKTLPTLRLHW
jgi:hypothetical protein